MRLIVSGLTKQGILSDISFSMTDGDRIALIGANGAGKTTFLKLLMGLIKPSSGRIQRMELRLSAVFQENLLDPELTVKQNLGCRLTDQSQLDWAFSKLMSFEIPANLTYAQLSGGQKRIVNYLRMLALRPNCLILDELSAGVDVEIREEIWQDLNRYFASNDCGVIFTTHLLNELTNANHILFINRGKVSYFGDLTTFMRQKPRYKVLVRDNVVEYVNSAKEGVEYLKNHQLLDQDFEILQTTYDDLFKVMGVKKDD